MTLEQTIQSQQNRIDELEQELVLLCESYKRYIDKVNANIAKLQEQVDNLLDPIERVLQNEENRPIERTPVRNDNAS